MTGPSAGKSFLFKIGMYVFTIGSLIASIFTNFNVLMVARVIQAIGAAATLSNSFGLISQIFPDKNRGRAMGFNTMFISAGFIAGPALGGLLLQYFYWNSIFMINIPIGIVAIIMSYFFLPKEKVGKMAKGFDWTGSILLFVIVAGFISYLEIGQNSGFGSPIMLLGILVIVILAIAFWYWERRHTAPILDFGLFKNISFTISLVAGVMVMIANSFFDIVFPFYLQDILNWSVGVAGLMMIAFPVVMAIFAPIGGALGDKVNRNLITIVGAILLILSQLMYTTFGLTTSVWLMLLATTINGIGTAFFVSNNTTLIMANVSGEQAGVAGAVQSLLTNLGQVLGVVFANISLYTTMSAKAGHRVNTIPIKHPDWFVDGMHVAFIVTTVLLVIALLIALRRNAKGFGVK
ncbi:MFS transporter [Pediococcus argentinicus]|uniref:MFS transporter n=1 Tax=Pediococcus argentinicus TaxID=480391 RepID=UPI0009F91E74|nr:MFS transporter [Pediococcus argentinicus]